MKKTSYFLICLVIVVIATLAAITFYKIKSISGSNIKPAECNIILSPQGPIDEVEFSSKPKSTVEEYLLNNGVCIEMTDSVDRPVITVDSIFRDYINIRLTDNRLKLDVSRDLSNEPKARIHEMLTICSYYDQSIRLVMPRHPLSRISSTFGMLEIRNLDTKKLTLFSNDRLFLTDCHIDSLILTAGGNAKMNFRDSAIDYMKLSMEDNFLKINCCDSSTLIKKVDFIARGNIKTNVFLNEANIDTFRWDPPEPTQLTVRIKHPINIVK